ncbi:hypothetical protein QMK19_36040 [Streptomyces sp. H10-C2]|nr:MULTISPECIES: hypothetical protein [unclassified Streptomyces]MDJ0344130.1 hypothetical protein [Streptomyces sp. PH10-H1]MDJ0374886.1 hypothetical protein [Streptomyces sp. H10-C2]
MQMLLNLVLIGLGLRLVLQAARLRLAHRPDRPDMPDRPGEEAQER